MLGRSRPEGTSSNSSIEHFNSLPVILLVQVNVLFKDVKIMLIPIVYLCGAREVMEEDLDPYDLIQDHWNPVEPAGLSDVAIETIANALVAAEEPLIITGYSGRNHACPPALVKLTETVKGLRVLDTGGSDMCFPADQPAWLGLRYGNDDSIRTADVILVIDCDVPWINTQCHPKKGAKIFHIDVDPLKQQMPVFYLAALFNTSSSLVASPTFSANSFPPAAAFAIPA